MNKKTILFLVSSILSQFVSILKSVISPLLLTPFQLGYINLININVGYFANSHLGVLHGMARLAPQTEVHGNLKLKNEIYRNSFWINLFFSFSFLVSFLFTSAKKIFFDENDFLFFVLIVFFQQIFTFYYIFYRTELNLVKLSFGSIIQSISIMLFFPILFYFLENKVIAILISSLFSFVLPLLYFIFPFQKFLFDFLSFKTSFLILKNGFPILMVGFLDIIFMSVDKFFISYFYGIENLGFYSIGVLFLTMSSSLYGTYGSTLYSGMIEKFARKGYSSASRSIILKPIIVSAFSLQFVILFSLGIVPSLITFFLPEYIDSINFVRSFILGSYFFSIASLCLFYLNSINKTKIIKMIQLVSICIILLEFAFIIFFDLGYLWVSFATLFGYVFYGISVLYITLNNIFLFKKRFVWRIGFKIMIPYFVIISVFLLFPTAFSSYLVLFLIFIFIFFINIFLHFKQINQLLKKFNI